MEEKRKISDGARCRIGKRRLVNQLLMSRRNEKEKDKESGGYEIIVEVHQMNCTRHNALMQDSGLEMSKIFRVGV